MAIGTQRRLNNEIFKCQGFKNKVIFFDEPEWVEFPFFVGKNSAYPLLDEAPEIQHEPFLFLQMSHFYDLRHYHSKVSS